MDTKEIYLDKWYEWIKWKNINKPEKKPKLKGMSEEIKEENKLINSIRMKVEHVIWKIKNYRWYDEN